MGNYTKNFDRDDFQCRCEVCQRLPNRVYTKVGVVQALQRLRDRYGKPITVTRGVSCTHHNDEVGGAPDSRHLPHHADGIDIACANSEEAYKLVSLAISLGEFSTIRVYLHHIHLDRRPGPFKFLASPEE